jgi:16S rRNA C1402 (ribose-2'-O) methylase RsmI
VDREREAAIRQFMDALQDQETRARALLAEMRRTLDAGTGAATAVHGALGSLEGILARTSAPSPPGSPPGHPFDVREYTRALEQLARSAREVEALLRSVNQDAPRLAALVGDAGREVSDRGRALVDHVFQRAVALVLVLVGSSLAAALVYRWVSSRIRRS